MVIESITGEEGTVFGCARGAEGVIPVALVCISRTHGPQLRPTVLDRKASTLTPQ